MNRELRLFKLFFVLIFIITLPLSAQQPPQKTVIKALAYGKPGDSIGQDWITAVEQFNKENTTFDMQYELLYEEDYHNKVTEILKIGGDAIPDIAYLGPLNSRWGDPWSEADQLFDHRPYIDKEVFDLSLIPSMGQNGEIWEIPLGTSNITTVLFMNEPLVNSLGFSIPKKYEDLVAMVPRAKEAGIEVVTINGYDFWSWRSCLLTCILARLSGDTAWVSKAVKGINKFTDKEFIASLAMVKKIITDGVISEKAIERDYATNLDVFGKGKALFMVQGQWAASWISADVQNVTLMLPWPAFPGEKTTAAGSVAAADVVGYGLTKKGGTNPIIRDAYLKFMKLYHSESRTTARLKDGQIVAPMLKLGINRCVSHGRSR